MGEANATGAAVPWYRRALRWGQTNITEIDPIRYDIDWWRQQWRRTRVQGVIVNAGGIVAYYPSRFELHHRAEALGERDLLGELVVAAREQGLALVARMDSNRAHGPFFEAHPDWFARRQDGEPYRAGSLYVACIHSPYYDIYLPALLREVIERYRPDGFADNSWSGLGRDSICYCEYCRRSFRDAVGVALPDSVDWSDPAYRAWVRWSYSRRLQVWDLNNATTREAGGPDCMWIGMNSGDILGQSRSFRDYRAICQRSDIVFLDNQTRHASTGFQANGDMGKLIHGLLGWEKLVPESMAMYQSPSPTFRIASRPTPEARMWMVEGFAGGIQPWWHHIGAYHDDRRQYRTAAPLMVWHERNERYLVNRRPVATVGLLWSQDNVDFYGREAPEGRVMTPYWGMAQALIRARIPYVPIHADDVATGGGVANRLSVLVLPNVGSLSDSQCDAVRQFVAAGGGLVATGESSLYDVEGARRADFALADVLGVHASGDTIGTREPASANWDAQEGHSYLRLRPEVRASVDGPLTGAEPPVTDARHPVLEGFDETDTLPFGGRLEVVVPGPGGVVPLTAIRPFPIYPPETAWFSPEAETGEPALVLNEKAGRGRVAYLGASLDHAFGKYNLPDHGRLLANLVRWVAAGRIPLQVTGTGLVDCHLYVTASSSGGLHGQEQQLVLHLINLSHPGAWRPPLHELIAVGPFEVAVQLPEGTIGIQARCLVSDQPVALAIADGWAHFDVERIVDHEVVVVDLKHA